MASLTVMDIARFINTWLNPVMGIITIVIGLVVCFGMNERLRVLGIWGVLMGITTILGMTTRLINYLYSIDKLDSHFFRDGIYNRIVYITGIIAAIMGLVGRFMVWLYARRNYGTKVLWIIIVSIIPIVTTVIKMVINKLTLRNADGKNIMALTTYSNSIIIIGGVAVSLIFMLIFYKNKGKENIIPLFWLFSLLSIIGSVLNYLLNIIYIHNLDNNNIYLCLTFFGCLGLLITPAACLYLLIKQNSREGLLPLSRKNT